MNAKHDEQDDMASEAFLADEAELRDESRWDWDNPEVQEGNRTARSSFSVRFESGELRLIREAARAAGMKTGEFIRNAALAAARGDQSGDATSALVELVERRGMKVTFEPAAHRSSDDVA